MMRDTYGEPYFKITNPDFHGENTYMTMPDVVDYINSNKIDIGNSFVSQYKITNTNYLVLKENKTNNILKVLGYAVWAVEYYGYDSPIRYYEPSLVYTEDYLIETVLEDFRKMVGVTNLENLKIHILYITLDGKFTDASIVVASKAQILFNKIMRISEFMPDAEAFITMEIEHLKQTGSGEIRIDNCNKKAYVFEDNSELIIYKEETSNISLWVEDQFTS